MATENEFDISVMKKAIAMRAEVNRDMAERGVTMSDSELSSAVSAMEHPSALHALLREKEALENSKVHPAVAHAEYQANVRGRALHGTEYAIKVRPLIVTPEPGLTQSATLGAGL